MRGLHVIMVPCGLVVRIRRSHRRGRGSIPRTGGNILLMAGVDIFSFNTNYKRKDGRVRFIVLYSV